MGNEASRLRIERYDASRAEDWARVLRGARNGIFQFERGYMEYHADRFEDLSLLAYEGDRAVALLPAAADGEGVVTSHPGLTFGGIVVERGMRSVQAIDALDAMRVRLREMGGVRWRIKVLPWVFASYPSGDIEYALWQRGFRLIRRELSSLLPVADAQGFSVGKQQAVRKARKAGLAIAAPSLREFHALLSSVLQARHGVDPVHSLPELELLGSRFPDRIFCRGAQHGESLVAGTLVFDYGRVWHTQYLASDADGRASGGLDLVVSGLIAEAQAKGVRYLSFGTSTRDGGRAINEGLLWQKESYGARALVHDTYEGDL